MAGNQYPQDAVRLKARWFASSDQLVHMIRGGEVYLGEPTSPRPGPSAGSSACRSPRTSCRRSASVRSWTTSGKEADIVLLDATALNVAPLNNVPGAVVSLMDRTNVETVIVGGKVRKWKGQLLGVNLSQLRHQLESSRDYIFAAAKIPQDPFGQ